MSENDKPTDPKITRVLQARQDIPRLVVNSGLIDADVETDPAIFGRLKQIMEKLPDDLLLEMSSRLSNEISTATADIEAFVERFGISKAEHRLLLALVDGTTVTNYAHETGISVNTARTHIRKLLEKTGSANQVDLVRRALGKF